MQALADVHEVVVLHRHGQIRDDRQHIPRVELGRVRREHHAHGVLCQHRTHLVLQPMTAHALHQTLEGFGSTHVVQLRVTGVFQGIDQHHLALDVLDDAEQKGRTFVRALFSLAAQKTCENVVRSFTLFKAQITCLLQQGHAQSRLADAVQRQGQENPVEHLVRVAHHRLIILLLTHDGCKVTSYF